MTWLICLGLAIVVTIWFLLQKPKPKRNKIKSAFYDDPVIGEGNLGKVINYDQGHGVRSEKLLSCELRLATHLDPDKAKRLVDNIQLKYPDKSRDWCASKALQDWQRDRQVT